MLGQHHYRYTVQEVLKKLKCLPADESDGEKDSDGLDSGSEADFEDTYSDDSVDDNHSSDSSCTANFSNESSVEADDSNEEEYGPTPKRRCAVPSSTPRSAATSQARSPSSDDSHEYESEECEEAMGDDTPPVQSSVAISSLLQRARCCWNQCPRYIQDCKRIVPVKADVSS